jgi:hypothetical protein
MSWLYSQVLVAEYLGDICSDGEQSVPLSGNNTQLAYLPQDKMTDFSRLSRFGMTFKPLTENLGEELLTLFQADFRAKTSVPQEKAQELTESGQECGGRWQGLLARYDPSTHSLRTVQCSLLEDSEQSLQTWPNWGSMRNGVCWEQPMLEQITKGTEFGLLPNGVDFFHTPNTTGLDGGSNSRKALKKRLENWPTPTAHNAKETNAPSEYKRDTPSLTATIHNRMWGTPKSQDSRHALRDRGKGNLGEQVSGLHNGGKLNPLWTEWLMGWPIGWTDLKPLETDKSHYVQQQHGTY